MRPRHPGFVEPIMMRETLFAICLLSSLALPCVHAQELSLLAGGLKQDRTDQHTYAWSLDYQQRLGEHAALGLLYLNEGHPDHHHRDGVGAQIWARAGTPETGLSFAAGIGPYYYFDTTPTDTADYVNNHGWGTLASLAATWDTQRRWFVQLRANRVFVPSGIDTSSVLLGVGYHLDGTQEPDAQSAAASSTRSSSRSATGHELTLSAGQTIVNSLHSEDAVAASLEYRHGLGRNLDWTLAWLHEDDARLVRRQGIATQLWLVRPLNQRFALGVGAGPYLAVDRDQGNSSAESGRKRLAGLLSLSARYRMSQEYLLRFSWSRVLTDYQRDTDLLLIGVGYVF
jgi:hypothetical protein